MIDLDTKQLHSFLRLVETGSFSKAARQIGCSQATMSVRIQKLEEAFGALLFERGHHEVSLTAEGRDLLPDIRSLVDLQDRMARRLQSKRVIGEVRLGIAEGFETALLPELLGYMLRNHAAAELDIHCLPSWRLQQMTEARSLDLAVVALTEETPAAVVLSRPRLHWVCAPGFALDPSMPVPVAWNTDNCFLQAAAASELEDRGIAYREVLRSADPRIVQAAVEAGMGITVMAEGTIPRSLSVMCVPSALPPLGRGSIQLLEGPAPRSEAVATVKRQIERAYREAEAAAA